MKKIVKSGVSFGLISGVITNLGLIIGLSSGTQSRFAVIGGILSIAIADSMSDALGLHVSEESKGRSSKKSLWQVAAAAFTSKFIFSLTFLIPMIVLPFTYAILMSIVWGIVVVGIVSYSIAKKNKENYIVAVVEHLGITVIVIMLTNCVGYIIRSCFS